MTYPGGSPRRLLSVYVQVWLRAKHVSQLGSLPLHLILRVRQCKQARDIRRRLAAVSLLVELEGASDGNKGIRGLRKDICNQGIKICRK